MSTHQHEEYEHQHAHGHEHDGHDHGHSHGTGGHHHHHAPQAGQGRTFALAVGLNVPIVIVQAVYGFLAHSTALLADTGHNLSDVLGLLLAWGAVWLGKRKPNARYTFGLGSSSILASLANAALLLFACGAIVLEAIQRLINLPPVAGLDVFIVATLGMVVNGFSAWLFMRGGKEDLNVRGAFLHMAADAAISAAVAVSGLVILFTGWSWLDLLMSLIVVSVIVWGHLGTGTRRHAPRDGRRAAGRRRDAHPRLSASAARRRRRSRPPRMGALHDGKRADRAPRDAGRSHPGDAFVQTLVTTLRREYSMHHATVQVEFGTECQACVLHARGHVH